MFALVAAALLFSPQTVELAPTDDVWVYPHASDPGRDPFLRAWGTDDRAVPDSPDDLDGYSFGYLHFDLTALPKEGVLHSANLMLTHTADPTYTAALVKNHPLEVRQLSASFDEKTWVYELTSKVMPVAEKDGLYGSGYPTSINADGKTFQISIDLLQGPGDFRKATNGKQAIDLALTSSISPEVAGRGGVYKVYSREADKESDRPKLVLVYE